MDALEIVKKQTADWIAASPTASDDLKALHRQLHGKKVLDFPRPKW